MEHVTDIAAKRAEIAPNAPAFIDVGENRTYTYGQVNDEAGRLARALLGAGLERGDRVAILCLNRVEVFVALFAAQKSGLVLAPLNWRQPVAELLPVANGIDAKLLIHDADFASVSTDLASRMEIPRLCLDAGVAADYNYGDFIAGAPETDLLGELSRSSDTWYLLHTSGTTGHPKAVIQTYAMAWANYINICQAVDLTGNDVSVNFLPLFHTAGINLYGLPLFMAGGLSYVLRRFDPDEALQMIDDGLISAFFGVPAIYQAFSLHPRFAEIDFSKTRSWACGGAPLADNLVHRFAKNGARVCAGFGMTETSPTIFIADEADAERKIGAVGKAQILADVRIVDGSGNQVPIGQSGELQVRGPNITPGYFGNAEATKAAFAEGGWLHTGDVARCDEDGYYYIVDRIKDMYISGGENVYPAEVERVLHSHPDILESAVLGVANEQWGEVGSAFLLPRPGHTLDIVPLESWCREHLAAYKIPKSFTVLDEDFPRTAAGKIQKHILKAQHFG